jgi:hypothetical protein
MNGTTATSAGFWEKYAMAVEDIAQRLVRISGALSAARVPFALVGGQAVALWVATKDPDAVRTTKDVDLLVRREDLPAVRKAALSVGMEYFEVLGVGMLLEKEDPHPRRAVHLLWAGEKVRAEYPLPSPSVESIETFEPGKPVVALIDLVRMKLMANRDHDRTHLRDMIDVGLIGRELLLQLPNELATRLDALLTEAGR